MELLTIGQIKEYLKDKADDTNIYVFALAFDRKGFDFFRRQPVVPVRPVVTKNSFKLMRLKDSGQVMKTTISFFSNDISLRAFTDIDEANYHFDKIASEVEIEINKRVEIINSLFKQTKDDCVIS